MMNQKTLRKSLKYMVPEIRPALIREPGIKPVAIRSPDDLEKFVEPMKLYAECDLANCLARFGELNGNLRDSKATQGWRVPNNSPIFAK